MKPPENLARLAFTKKQMGDACEMIVAAELTLAGIPALKVPDNWPGYDVIAQPFRGQPQRISVKARTFKNGAAYVQYQQTDVFDWLAIVILNGHAPSSRSVYLAPRNVVDDVARRNAPGTRTERLRYIRISEIEGLLGRFRDNFILRPEGLHESMANNEELLTSSLERQPQVIG
ncbi:hypothetical protein I7G59_03800 [Sinorhizobium meliloti]|uniref:hypothetical protein n=1 Tax=Rhizobium meliloti TaxID=382 RepID=UPI0023808679|nr:hypothetical protein [Sinorhizobium meliloti]MDE3796454.1 hypothetical protein [Sinorhizobium meliloti]